MLAEAGADTKSFAEFASGEGRAVLNTVHSQADQFGVFGVLTIVLDGEIFWGREQFPVVRLRLNELGLGPVATSKPSSTSPTHGVLAVPGWEVLRVVTTILVRFICDWSQNGSKT